MRSMAKNDYSVVREEQTLINRPSFQNRFLSLLELIIVFVFIHTPIYSETDCSKTNLPDLPELTIISITQETEFAPHCLVSGIIGKEIKFELRLPEEWNGKFVFGGGGGFVGGVVNFALSYGALQKGYATVGTNTGHEAHSLDASWANYNMERIVNFGHLAVHRTTVTSKHIIEHYYGQKINKSYFFGCSRGGGQALIEAQRYPNDFDGIVAGAPALNWTTSLAAASIQIQQLMFPDPDNLDYPVLDLDDLKLIEDSYLAQCDAMDGIVDGILNEPDKCDFNIETLLCNGEKNEQCLTQEEIDAAKAVYDGPKDKIGSLAHGFPFGGESDAAGWPLWHAGGLKYMESLGEYQAGVESAQSFESPITPNATWAFSLGIMRHMIYHDSTWSYVNYNFDNFREDAELAGHTLNATNPDLSEFRNNGGKLLIYTGWSDCANSPYGIIEYYKNVLALDATALEDVKLFLMPGVLHCAGGKGPSLVNWIDEIDNWVEKNENPDQITAYFLDEKNQISGSRPICPYPSIPIYDGKGDTRDVKSFTCGDSK